jgi:hypothetical protein
MGSVRYKRADMQIVLSGSGGSLTTRQRGRGIYSVKILGGSRGMPPVPLTILMSAKGFKWVQVQERSRKFKRYLDRL